MKRRLLALNLALVLLLSLLPLQALAVDAKPGEPARYDSLGNWDHESVMFTPEETGYYRVSMTDPNGNRVSLGSSSYSSGGNMSMRFCAFDWDENPLSSYPAGDAAVYFLRAGQSYEFYLDPGNYYSTASGEWAFHADLITLPNLKMNEPQHIDINVSGGCAAFTPDADGFYYFEASKYLMLQSEDDTESWGFYSGYDYDGNNYSYRLVAELRAGETYCLTFAGNSNRNSYDITVTTDIPRNGRLNYYLRWSVSEDGVLSIIPTDSDSYRYSSRDFWPWDAFRDEIQQIQISKGVYFYDIDEALWCRNLNGFTIADRYSYNNYYQTEDGVIFTDNGSTLVRYPFFEPAEPEVPPTDEPDEPAEPVETPWEKEEDYDTSESLPSTNYVIPDNVTYVSGLAFTNLTALETLEIPANSVVASNAFVGTHSLREIRYLGSERAWNRMNIVFDEGYEPVVTFGAEEPQETVKPIDDNADRVAYAATRAGVMQMFWEMNGQPEPSSVSNPFTDVSENAPYCKAVFWAVEQGITAGTSSTTFSPDNSVTRGQLATFLWRAMGSPATSGPCIYEDVSSNMYYYDPIRWVQDHTGQFVFSGVNGEFFYPDDEVDSLCVEYLRDGDWSRVLIGRIDCPEHNWEQSEVREATCLRWGFVTYTCTNCGAVKRERGNAPLGHDFQPWETDYEATCEWSGREKSVCLYDENHVIYREVEPLGHDWSDWFVTQPATADKEGLMTRVCHHDSSHVEQQIIPPLHVKIRTQPADVKAAAGDAAVFTVEATGDSLTYRWQYSDDGGETWRDADSAESSVSFVVEPAQDGRLLRCVVRDRFGNEETSQSAKLYLLSDEQPVILAQPEDQLVSAGGDAVFTVSAKGPGLTYQWYFQKSGKTAWYAATGIGAQTPELTIQAAESRDGQSYRCKVTTAAGNYVYSEPAKLAVLTGPYIQTQPQDASDVIGKVVTFSVTALGNDLTYKWEYSTDGGNTWLASSSKKASATCTLSSESRDGWLYRCTVTDGSGQSVVSRTARVTVLTKPVITQQPQDAIGTTGEVLKFTIAAKGTNLTYQWQYSTDSGKSWTASSSKTTTATCTLTASRDGWLYRCIVRDGNGNSVISDTARVTVLIPLAITSQPQDAVGRSGDVLKFRIGATGKGLTYKWQYSKDGGRTWIPSSSKSTVATCTLVPSRDGWLYRCIVSDAGGNSVMSNVAHVRVVEGIRILSQPQDASGQSGSVVKFSVTAIGEGLTYQWQYSTDGGYTWTDSSSKTDSATCTLAANRDGWLYRCIVRDAFGDSVISATARVKVLPPVVITKQPTAATGKVGDVVKFTIAASGKNLTYQWQYSTDGGKTWKASSSKTTTATCTLAANRDGWLYRCIVKDANGYTVTSNTARVIVK